MTTNGLHEALHVDGPAGPDAERLHLYGQFVGSWDITWAGIGPDGRPVTARGELHFGWVLGGRAVQDVWIVPGRGARGEQISPLFVPRLGDPLLRPRDRRLALHLDRSPHGPRAPLHRRARSTATS